jgi:uncharacterized protein (UPF0335 family)
VFHVQELERLEERRAAASEAVKEAYDKADAEGYDKATLRVVLKLRKMTPLQRRERRALEAIYLAALGMLEGDALSETARRRLDGMDEPGDKRPDEHKPDHSDSTEGSEAPTQEPAELPEQPALILKDPAEAKVEGAQAAADGKRIYDNPYPAGDPCRAAWDEGWCGQHQTHGMETPAAYRRRTEKPPKKDDAADHGSGESQRGAA